MPLTMASPYIFENAKTKNSLDKTCRRKTDFEYFKISLTQILMLMEYFVKFFFPTVVNLDGLHPIYVATL